MFIVKWEKMEEVIEALNDSNLTDKLNAKPSGQIIHNFMKAVEAIPEGMDASIPEIVTDFYNDLVVKIEDEGKSVVLDVNEVKEKEKGKKKRKVEDPLAEGIMKDEDEKKKQTKITNVKQATPLPMNKRNVEKDGYGAQKDEYGSKIIAGTHKINNFFKEGLLTMSEIAEKLETTLNRIKNHHYYLIKKNVKFEAIKHMDGRVVYKIVKER